MNHAASPPLVYVVVLNYNGQAYLEKFLPPLLRTDYPYFQVIVGDNASTDDSVAFLQAHYPEVWQVSNPENMNFARGYNQIIQKTLETYPCPKYLVLLNSDVEVRRDWLSPLVQKLEQDPNIAAVQPKILSFHHRDTFEYAGASGGYIDILGYLFCRGRLFEYCEKDIAQYEDERRIAWVSGSAFCIRTECFVHNKGFNPYFIAHQEEIDLCWRLHKQGYAMVVVPSSVVFHVGGGTLSYHSHRKIFLNHRNNLIMLANHLPVWAFVWRLFVRGLIELGGLSVYNICLGKFSLLKPVFQAYYQFLLWYWKDRKQQDPAYISRTKAAPYWYRRPVLVDIFLLRRKIFSSLPRKFFPHLFQ